MIMKKVHLTMSEENKYLVIKRLVERGGNKLNAAVKLNCTERTINRLIRKYKLEGKSAFIHKNKNRKPSTALDEATKKQIVDLYQHTYFDFNITHFNEFLKEVHDIHISTRSIRNYLLECNIISPKAQRLTKRLLKKKLKTELTHSNKKRKIELQNSLKILEYPDIHPRKPRAKYFGEQIQMDASEHLWFGLNKTALHTAIDDHSGIIIGAYFTPQESIKGYFNVLKQILMTYGIPALFFTDKRTIFEYRKAPAIKEDTYTQFSYASHQLGIAMKSSSVPQAKGRVERSYNTLQSRLVAEMRLYRIHTLDQANLFLSKFIIQYNKQFALSIDNSVSVFEPSPSETEIDNLLVTRHPRHIDHGHSISYLKKTFIPVNQFGNPVFFKKNTHCLVIKTLDDQLFVNIEDTLYLLEEVHQHHHYSPEFDEQPIKTEKKRYIPPMSHPWKRSSFDSFVSKQKHHYSGTHVSSF